MNAEKLWSWCLWEDARWRRSVCCMNISFVKYSDPPPPFFTTIRGYSLSILSYLTKEQKLQKGVYLKKKKKKRSIFQLEKHLQNVEGHRCRDIKYWFKNQSLVAVFFNPMWGLGKLAFQWEVWMWFPSQTPKLQNAVICTLWMIKAVSKAIRSRIVWL